jgi:HlyD family secretion protein
VSKNRISAHTHIQLYRHYAGHHIRGKGLLWVLMGVVLSSLLTLPLIHVDVTVQSKGIVRSMSEVHQLSAPLTARINRILVTEHQTVQVGDTLVCLDHSAIDQELQAIQEEWETFSAFVSDLDVLLQSNGLSNTIKTKLLQKEQAAYLGEYRTLHSRVQKLKVDYERSAGLYAEGVLSRVQFEKDSFELSFSKNALDELQQNSIRKWQGDHQNYTERIAKHETSLARLQQEKLKHYLLAPINGEVVELSGVSPGTFALENEHLITISPQETLIAECYVSPRDIGLIQDSMLVRLQVDAFHYTQWGLLEARVLSVGQDVIQREGDFFFQVKCRLNQTYLIQQNGLKGELRKGMSVLGRFVVNRRSLFQLLFDTVDDWMNPKVYTPKPAQ